MANHLTPAELAQDVKLDQRDVIELCLRHGVPIYHGRVDKTLFAAATNATKSGREPVGV